jgi:hypothetical protein
MLAHPLSCASAANPSRQRLQVLTVAVAVVAAHYHGLSAAAAAPARHTHEATNCYELAAAQRRGSVYPRTLRGAASVALWASANVYRCHNHLQGVLNGDLALSNPRHRRNGLTLLPLATCTEPVQGRQR